MVDRESFWKILKCISLGQDYLDVSCQVFHRGCIETALRQLGRAGEGHCPLCRNVIRKTELLEKPADTWKIEKLVWNRGCRFVPSTFSETIRHRWYQKGSKYWWFIRVWRLDSGTNLQPWKLIMKCWTFQKVGCQMLPAVLFLLSVFIYIFAKFWFGGEVGVAMLRNTHNVFIYTASLEFEIRKLREEKPPQESVEFVELWNLKPRVCTHLPIVFFFRRQKGQESRK